MRIVDENEGEKYEQRTKEGITEEKSLILYPSSVRKQFNDLL